eukprot:scaffold25310_cov49-Phaeocystis_antarctica.AAC.2
MCHVWLTKPSQKSITRTRCVTSSSTEAGTMARMRRALRSARTSAMLVASVRKSSSLSTWLGLGLGLESGLGLGLGNRAPCAPVELLEHLGSPLADDRPEVGVLVEAGDDAQDRAEVGHVLVRVRVSGQGQG